MNDHDDNADDDYCTDDDKTMIMVMMMMKKTMMAVIRIFSSNFGAAADSDVDNNDNGIDGICENDGW